MAKAKGGIRGSVNSNNIFSNSKYIMMNSHRYIQPPLHFNNNSPGKITRLDGKVTDDGSTQKLSHFLRSPPRSPAHRFLASQNKHNSSSFSPSSPFRRTFGAEMHQWESKGMPRSPIVVNNNGRNPSPSAPHTPAAAATNALTSDLLSITDGLKERIEHAAQDPTTRYPPGSPESKFKQDLLRKIAYLVERFHQVAQVSTTLEKRVHDLQAYCVELEERLVQKNNTLEEAAVPKTEEKEKKEEKKEEGREEEKNKNHHINTMSRTESASTTALINSLTHENSALRNQLATVHDQLDQKDERFDEISDATIELSKRIEQGESLLSNMHAMMGQMAARLHTEHAQRLQAEAALLYEQQQHQQKSEIEAHSTASKRQRRRLSLSRVGISHYSADEADDEVDEAETDGEKDSNNLTPMAQYDGGFATKKHFDTYLTKLEAIRGKATRERETAREKRRRNERTGTASSLPTSTSTTTPTPTSTSKSFSSPTNTIASTVPLTSSPTISIRSPVVESSATNTQVQEQQKVQQKVQHKVQQKVQKSGKKKESIWNKVRNAIAEDTIHHRRYSAKSTKIKKKFSQIPIEDAPVVKSHVVGVNDVDASVARQRQNIIENKREKNLSVTEDPVLPTEFTPRKLADAATDVKTDTSDTTETNSTAINENLVETSEASLLRTPPLRQSGWSNLDVLDQVRDLHDHGVSMLERMNESSSEVGSEERRRAEIDAHKLESQVDMLTRQYRDLLNSVSPSPAKPRATSSLEDDN